MKRLFILLICVFATVGAAQITLVKTEKIPLKTTRAWAMPQWSPDGASIYFTAADFNGIWAYSIRARTTALITSDRQSGYGFSVSPDGKRVAYRRTLTDPRTRERRQEAVVKRIADGGVTVLISGGNVAVPSFANSDVVYSNGTTTLGITQSAQAGRTALLGTENNTIAILRDGVKKLLDPLGGNGRYIWPALSPDGKRIVAYDMERGTVVADVDGANPVRLGKRNAAVWTRDGRWLVYMDDKDDGHAITGSEVAFVSPDGKVSARLTSTPRRTEMYPQCSPTADRIVCSTLEGEILVLTYAEAGR